MKLQNKKNARYEAEHGAQAEDKTAPSQEDVKKAQTSAVKKLKKKKNLKQLKKTNQVLKQKQKLSKYCGSKIISDY